MKRRPIGHEARLPPGAVRLTVLDDDALAGRPRSRGECAELGRHGERPCPWVGCKHNLFLDVNPVTGTIKFNFPGADVADLVETCALDIADRGGVTLEEVGGVMNLTRERVRQIEVRATAKMRLHAPGADEH